MLETVFENTLKKYNLLKKKDKLILGVSGGPDSLAMLYNFLKLKNEYKLYLVCAHFNHSLRKEADKEEEFIRKICKGRGIRFISEKKDVTKFFNGDSLEQTARNLRFDFFGSCSRAVKIKKIALAHHKDDLIETVLMRLIRGSGLRGLRGFLPKSKFQNLTVIRPLIELRKKEILNWLKKEGLSYCIDKSNLDEKFLRNRIRSKVLPFLGQLNPNIGDSLYNLARSAALDYEFIREFSREKFISLKKKETKNGLSLCLEGLKGLNQAIFNNVIRIAIEEVKGNIRRIESRHLEEVKDLVFSRPSGSMVDLPSLLFRKQESLKGLLLQVDRV